MNKNTFSFVSLIEDQVNQQLEDHYWKSITRCKKWIWLWYDFIGEFDLKLSDGQKVMDNMLLSR